MDELDNILKQQAASLLLTPSPAVWMNVEADIERRERKRRFLFLLLLLAGLMVAGLTCYYLFAAKHINDEIGKVADHPAEQQYAVNEKTSGHYTKTAKNVNEPVIEKKKDPNETITSVPAYAEPDIEQIDGPDMQNSAVNEQVSNPQETIIKDEIADLKSMHPANSKPGFSKTTNTGKLIGKTGLESVAIHPVPSPPTETVVQKAVADLQPMHPASGKSGIPKKQSHKQTVADPGHETIAINPIQKELQAAIVPSLSASIGIVKPTTKQAAISPASRRPVPASIRQIIASEPAIVVKDPVVLKKEPAAQTDKEIKQPDPVTAAPEPKKQQRDRWAISVSLAPNMSFSKLKEQSDSQFIEKYRNKTSRHLISADYNIKAYYKALPDLEIYTGIGIRNMGERLSAKQDIYEKGIGTSGPNTRVNRTQRILLSGDSGSYLSNRFSYLEMPLGIRYRMFHTKKFSASIDAGAGINRLIRASGNYYDSTLFTYQPLTKDKLQPWLFSFGGGLSIQYVIKDDLRIELMPYYRRTPGSVLKEDHKLSQYIQQAGVSISVRYDFKRKGKK